MPEDTIRVVIARPGEVAEIAEIKNTLGSLQQIVEGYIETVYTDEETIMIVNEEGRINGMPFNRVILDKNGKPVEEIYGPIIIVGDAGENFGSLTTAQAYNALGRYYYPNKKMEFKGEIWYGAYDPEWELSEEEMETEMQEEDNAEC